SERQEIRGKGLIAGGFHLDDEVIGAYGEMAGLDLNAKFLGHLPCGGSTFRCVLDGTHTLISEVAEKHVRGHGTPPLRLPRPQGIMPCNGFARQKGRPWLERPFQPTLAIPLRSGELAPEVEI